MSKRSGRSLSKKWMPVGARRITNAEGLRVWFHNDKEFNSLRELIYATLAGKIKASEQTK